MKREEGGILYTVFRSEWRKRDLQPNSVLRFGDDIVNRLPKILNSYSAAILKPTDKSRRPVWPETLAARGEETKKRGFKLLEEMVR